MAKDHTGILLLIAACLRSTKGRELLRKRVYFRNEAHVRDWSMLVETLLQWEMWLKSDSLKRHDVMRARSSE